jgi:hypothetical protein
LVRGRLGVRRIARLALGAAVLLGAFSGGRSADTGFVLVASARAQTEAELTAARQLFAEALADEQAGRHAAALDKFQRVQAVRDTQAVRYRIATCLEALGQLRAALAAYTSTSVAGAVDAESASIARASRDKVEALSKRVARVVVTLPAHSPSDSVVKIDGEAVQANAIGTPIVVDPGAHEISASGSGVVPFHAHVTLAEGAQSTIEATLPPAAGPAAPATPAPHPPGVAEPARPFPPEPEATPRATTARSGRQTSGIVLVGGGGALVAAATAILIVRHFDIQSLQAACPRGVCPLNRQSELEGTRNRAVAEGPLGVGVGVAGIVAAGVGVYLLVTPARLGPKSAIAPWVDRGAGGLAWTGSF